MRITTNRQYLRSDNATSNIVLCSLLLGFTMLTASTANANYNLKNANLSKVDTSKWVCKFCPEEARWTGSLSLVSGYSKEEASARFKHSPAEGGGTQAHVDSELDYADEDQRANLLVDQLGLDNANATLRFSNHNSGTQFTIGYQASELDYHEGGQSVFTNPGDTSLILPADWSKQSTTATMDLDGLTVVQSPLNRMNLETSVKQLIGSQGGILKANYRHIKRSGVDWQYGSILSQVTALSLARDDTTKEVTLSVAMPFSQSSAAGNIGIEFFQSLYENDISHHRWENPFTSSIAGTETGALSSQPDNQFEQWRMFADFSHGSHQLMASLSMGIGEQNQEYLPYTVNPFIATSSLHRQDYDGETQTRNARVGWRFNPEGVWRFSANYRFDKRNNESEVNVYQSVLTDSVLSGDMVNSLYSHNKHAMDVYAEWRWRSSSRFYYRYDYGKFERTEDNINRMSSHGLTFGWKERWSNVVSSRFELFSEERDGKTKLPLDFSQNKYFQEYTFADRIRDKVDLEVNWQCSHWVNLNTQVYYVHDNYDKTIVGVTDLEEMTVSAGISWQFSRAVEARLVGLHSWFSWDMNGSAQQSLPTWRSVQEDRVTTLVTGFSHQGLMDEKLKLGMEFSLVAASGENGVTGAGEYPRVESYTRAVQIYADYLWSESWQLRAETLYENYDGSDWRLSEINASPNLLANGQVDEDYSEWFFGLRLRYQL